MPERPRIVWDALLVRPEPTGVGRSILELAHAMSHQDRGCDFAVLATHPEMFAFLNGRPHWQVWPCPQAEGGVVRKALYTQLGLPKLIEHLQGHILHSLHFAAPLQRPCLSVVTVHDLAFLDFPQTVEQPRRAYYRWLVPRTLRRADAVLTNSEATAAAVAGHFPELANRLTVTPFGTPTWVWRQSPASGQRGEDAPFLFVGTLEPRKNLLRLLQAYRAFLDRRRQQDRLDAGPPLALVGGKGWREASLRPHLDDLARRGKLRLEGYCEPARLWQLYCAARALLFPSLQEGFGFPILEAMAAGLPVLTANRGAMREVAGEAALLVDPEDTGAIAAGIERLHADAGLCTRLSRAGPARAAAWSWERTAALTTAAYHRLLAQAQPAAQKK
jgi:glycosyltransferase involved in cell wall biosynthesis